MSLQVSGTSHEPKSTTSNLCFNVAAAEIFDPSLRYLGLWSTIQSLPGRPSCPWRRSLQSSSRPLWRRHAPFKSIFRLTLGGMTARESSRRKRQFVCSFQGNGHRRPPHTSSPRTFPSSAEPADHGGFRLRIGFGHKLNDDAFDGCAVHVDDSATWICLFTSPPVGAELPHPTDITPASQQQSAKPPGLHLKSFPYPLEISGGLHRHRSRIKFSTERNWRQEKKWQTRVREPASATIHITSELEIADDIPRLSGKHRDHGDSGNVLVDEPNGSVAHHHMNAHRRATRTFPNASAGSAVEVGSFVRTVHGTGAAGRSRRAGDVLRQSTVVVSAVKLVPVR